MLPVDLPAPAPDGLTYVTTATAARLLGIAPCTVTSWKAKKYLRPVTGSPPGKPLYLWDDVLEAEYTAYQNAVRTSGTDVQVRRSRKAPVTGLAGAWSTGERVVAHPYPGLGHAHHAADLGEGQGVAAHGGGTAVAQVQDALIGHVQPAARAGAARLVPEPALHGARVAAHLGGDGVRGQAQVVETLGLRHLGLVAGARHQVSLSRTVQQSKTMGWPPMTT